MSPKHLACNSVVLIKRVSLYISIATSLLLSAYTAAEPSTPPGINILVIHSYSEDIPWNHQITRGFDEFIRESGVQFNIFREYLETNKKAGELNAEEVAENLTNKYSRLNIDVVFGESDGASDFVMKYQDQFAPNAGTILFSSGKHKATDSVLHIRADMHYLADYLVIEAVAQNRDATQALIIEGDNAEPKSLSAAISQYLTEHPSIQVEVIKDFSLDSLKKRLLTFPHNGIIFYTVVFRDSSGTTYIPKEFLTEILSTATAPIYVTYSSLMGTGAVGGYVVDGVTLARSALDATKNFKLYDSFMHYYTANTYMFDWKALRKHHIEQGLLPTGTQIVNHPNSFIRENYVQIIIALTVAIIIMLAAIFTASFLSRRNKALHSMNSELSSAHSQLNTAHTELVTYSQQLDEIATQDYLTNTLNRRAAKQKIMEKVTHSIAVQEKVALLLIDVDLFKEINDQHGHQFGDEVLITVAQIIAKALRKSDIVSRWGGDEFLVAASVHSHDQAMNIAEKIRSTVQRHTYDAQDACASVSIGIANLPNGREFEAAFKKADTALYESKQKGRNCITCHF